MLSNFYEDGNFILDYIQDATLYNCKLSYCFLEDLYINNSPIGLNGPNEARFTNITVNNILVTSGNLGIGIANPAYDLDVLGDINFTGNLFKNGVPLYTGGGGTGGNGSTSVFLTRSAQSIGTQTISSGSNVLKFPDNERSSGQIVYNSTTGAFYVTLEGVYSIFVDVDFYNANRAVDLYILKNGVEDSSEGRIAWVNCPANDAATINANVYLESGDFITVNIFNNSGDSFTTPYANNKVNSFGMALFNSSQWQGDTGNPISYTAASVTMLDTIITNLTVDNVLVSNGSVGIGGVADPDYKLDVFGDINFSGDLYKNDVLYLPRPVYITRSAQTKDAQSINSGDNVLKFPDSGQDTGDINYNPTTGRFTVNQDGLYSIFVDVDFYNADRAIDLYILKNGVEDSINGRIAWINCPANDATSINAMVYLEETDYITVVVKNNSANFFTTPYDSNKVNSFAMSLINSSSSPRASQWTGDIGSTISYTSGTTLMTNASVSNITIANANISNITIANANISNITIGNGLVTGNLRAISNSNTVGALFTTGGNVGIGNSSPIGRLHTVMDSATANGAPGLWDSTYAVFGQASASGGAVGLGYHAVSGGSLSSITPGIAWRRMVYRADSHNFFAQGDNQRMIINNSGNIGIGTTSPSSNLDVFGIISNAGGGNSRGHLKLNDNGSNTGFIEFFPPSSSTRTGYIGFGSVSSNIAYYIAAEGSNNMLFLTGGGERMRINPSGNVGIGTNNPTLAKLQVDGSVSTNLTARFYNSAGANGSATTSRPLSIYASDHIACAELQVFSDERIKKNLNDINDSNALEILRQIKPKTYKYIDTLSRTDIEVIGFIAQEVRSILPHAVDLCTDYVPNIYTMTTVGNFGTQLLFPKTISTSVLHNQTTDGSTYINIKLYVDENNTQKFRNIVSIIDEHTVEIDKPIDQEQVFVYGQAVNDFHTLNKNAIWTIATAALREVDRQLQTEKQKHATTRADLDAAQLRIGALEAFLQSKFPGEI